MTTVTTTSSHIDLATLIPLVNEFIDHANIAEHPWHCWASPADVEVAIELMNDRAQAITETLPAAAEWEAVFTGPTVVGVEVTYEGAVVRITPVRFAA